MKAEEFLPFAITAIGTAFGFGRQSANISQNKKDIRNVSHLNEELLRGMHELRERLIRIESDLDHLKNK
jgi:hypothetical protein